MLSTDARSVIAANNLASLLSNRRGDPASVDRALTIASRFNASDVPQFLDTLGWIYFLKSEYDQALPLLKKAAEKVSSVGAGDASAGTIQYHLALTYKEVGQGEAAIAALKRALELLPQDAPESGKARVALDQLVSTDNAASSGNSN